MAYEAYEAAGFLSQSCMFEQMRTGPRAQHVSLSTDDPPVLSALAPGHVTITAGATSADITVWPAGALLPPGTIQWSNPGNASGV